MVIPGAFLPQSCQIMAQGMMMKQMRGVRDEHFMCYRPLTWHTGGVSMCNNGKRITFTVQFTALLKPTDKKCHKDATSKPVSKIIFMHEDMGHIASE
jgi:hypothetical protein